MLTRRSQLKSDIQFYLGYNEIEDADLDEVKDV